MMKCAVANLMTHGAAKKVLIVVSKKATVKTIWTVLMALSVTKMNSAVNKMAHISAVIRI